MNNYNPFQKFLAEYRPWYHRLPSVVSIMAKKDIVMNFRRQGYYNGQFFSKWAQRKGKQKGKQRAILIQSGRLWRSIREAPIKNIARVVTDVPYAQIHNEGGHIKGTFRISEHSRTTFRRVKTSSLKTRKTRTQRVAAGTYKVRSHERKVDNKITARPFMVTSPQFDQDMEHMILTDTVNMFLKSIPS